MNLFSKLSGNLSAEMLKPVMKQVKTGMLSNGLKATFLYIGEDGKLAIKTFKDKQFVISESIFNKLNADIQKEILAYNGYDQK